MICANVKGATGVRTQLNDTLIFSEVSRSTFNTLLGFSFYNSNSLWEIRIFPKSIQRIKEKLKAGTRRSNPVNANNKIQKLDRVICGWVNYFAIAKAKKFMQRLDEMVRVCLRMGIWSSWKRIRTKIRNFIRLGVSSQRAYMWGNSSKRYCKVAHSPILSTTLNDNYWPK